MIMIKIMLYLEIIHGSKGLMVLIITIIRIVVIIIASMLY